MARTDYYAITTPTLQATSQAIRSVNGTVGTIAPEDYPDLISAMKSGADYDNVMAQLIEETTTPAAIASFTDGANNLPCKEIVCSINPTETGTGAKSPSNPYVIGGHTEINVTQTGKNLFDVTAHEGFVATQSGVTNTQLATGYKTENSAAATRGCELIIEDLPQGNFYISYISKYDDDTSINVFVYKNGSLVGSSSTGLSFSSSGNDTFKLTIFVPSNRFVTVNDIQIEVGSTTTTYEPYNGQTHHADFGQTVFGGSLNVTTGLLTIDNGYRVFDGSDDENWELNENLYGYNLFVNDMNTGSYLAGLCDKFQTVKNTSSTGIRFGLDSSRRITVMKLSDYLPENTIEAWRTWLATNNIFIVYPLATPQTIQLDPIEVKTLLGANNLYHDCNGNIEVTYRANGALYVAQH